MMRSFLVRLKPLPSAVLVLFISYSTREILKSTIKISHSPVLFLPNANWKPLLHCETNMIAHNHR